MRKLLFATIAIILFSGCYSARITSDIKKEDAPKFENNSVKFKFFKISPIIGKRISLKNLNQLANKLYPDIFVTNSQSSIPIELNAYWDSKEEKTSVGMYVVKFLTIYPFMFSCWYDINFDLQLEIFFKANKTYSSELFQKFNGEYHVSYLSPLGLISIIGDTAVEKTSGTDKEEVVYEYMDNYIIKTIIYTTVKEIKKIDRKIWQKEYRHQQRLNNLNQGN